MKRLIMGFCISVALYSCAGSETTEEQQEIKVMDSSAATVGKTTDELEEQTRKVEASLDELDKDSVTSNQ